ncbi:hypothetical protein OSTOST_06321 [Ostertagia ostertagi]
MPWQIFWWLNRYYVGMASLSRTGNKHCTETRLMFKSKFRSSIRAKYKTTYEETVLLEPEGVQEKINALVAQYNGCTSVCKAIWYGEYCSCVCRSRDIRRSGSSRSQLSRFNKRVING